MNGYPRAYCAPGRHADAAATLAINGESVASLTEHPYLEEAPRSSSSRNLPSSPLPMSRKR